MKSVSSLLDGFIRKTSVLVLALLAGPVLAELDLTDKSPQEAGMAIAVHAEAVHGGWLSSESTGRMVLSDASGDSTEKELKTWLLEADDEDDGGRSFIVYDNKGTALLTHMNRSRDDNQWVWVPGLKRKMRIKASNVSGAFIGSEFAIEDLRSQYPEKFDITLLGEEEYDGQACWKLQRVPKVEETGYSKHVVWIDKAEFRVLKTDFYDRKDELLKTLTTHDWQQHNDKFWRAHHSEMVNHQTGRKSDMFLDTVELDVGMKKVDFEAGRGLMR